MSRKFQKWLAPATPSFILQTALIFSAMGARDNFRGFVASSVVNRVWFIQDPTPIIINMSENDDAYPCNQSKRKIQRHSMHSAFHFDINYLYYQSEAKLLS